MLEFLAFVPEAIWAAVGGALLTLLGVAFQNRAETRRLKVRLAHEAEQRTRERDLQLRRDLYLEAADSAFRAQRSLLAIANIEKPLGEIGAGSDPMDFAGLGKAHLVGRLETIKALDGISSSLRDQVFGLFRVRFELEEAKIQLENASENVTQLTGYRDQFVATVREMSSNAQLEAAQMEGYVQRFQELQKRLEVAIDARARAQQVFEQRRRSMLIKSVGAGVAYSAALANACVTVRNELEQIDGFDATEYEQHVQDSSRRTLQLWQQFVDDTYRRFGGADSQPNPALHPTGAGES